jgi:hypothetical protein
MLFQKNTFICGVGREYKQLTNGGIDHSDSAGNL